MSVAEREAVRAERARTLAGTSGEASKAAGHAPIAADDLTSCTYATCRRKLPTS